MSTIENCAVLGINNGSFICVLTNIDSRRVAKGDLLRLTGLRGHEENRALGQHAGAQHNHEHDNARDHFDAPEQKIHPGVALLGAAVLFGRYRAKHVP
jgi:hypothetical protein